MQLVPYLNFDGNCAEALEFYAEVFGGRIVRRQTFGEMPPMEGMPPMGEECNRRIMHMHVQIKEQSLMASDTMPAALLRTPAPCPNSGEDPIVYS